MQNSIDATVFSNSDDRPQTCMAQSKHTRNASVNANKRFHNIKLIRQQTTDDKLRSDQDERKSKTSQISDLSQLSNSWGGRNDELIKSKTYTRPRSDCEYSLSVPWQLVSEPLSHNGALRNNSFQVIDWKFSSAIACPVSSSCSFMYSLP